MQRHWRIPDRASDVGPTKPTPTPAVTIIVVVDEKAQAAEVDIDDADEREPLLGYRYEEANHYFPE